MSTTALSTRRGASLAQRLNMSEEQLELIRRMCVHPDAPDDVVELYLFRCRSVGCDPMDKMIFVIPRKQNVKDPKTDRWTSETRWTFQSSIDLFRSVAEDSGDYAGQLGPYWTADGATWLEVWLSPDPPLACRIGVLRNSFKEPLWVTATYAYYVPRDRNGNPEPTAFWKGEKGAHQLAKCTEELALRKAFPRKLHGLYGSEEMDQSGKPARQPKRAAEAAETPAVEGETPLDAQFEALPPALGEDEAEKAREGAAKQVVILASQRKIPDAWRHEVAVKFFGEPSTKKLAIGDLRKLYALLVRLSQDVSKEPAGAEFAFEAWLDYVYESAQEATAG